GEHIDAVRVLLDHPLQPTHLALDTAQSTQQGLLVGRVPVTAVPVGGGRGRGRLLCGHAATIPPGRMRRTLVLLRRRRLRPWSWRPAPPTTKPETPPRRC